MPAPANACRFLQLLIRLGLVLPLPHCAAPMAGFPAFIPQDFDEFRKPIRRIGEFGLGVGANETRYVAPCTDDRCVERSVVGHLWHLTHLEKVSVGGWLAGQYPPAVAPVGFGALIRGRLVKVSRAEVSIQTAIGFGQFAFAVPVAVRLLGGIWVYTVPAIGAQMGRGRLAVGVGWHTADLFTWYLEGMASRDLPFDRIGEVSSYHTASFGVSMRY